MRIGPYEITKTIRNTDPNETYYYGFGGWLYLYAINLIFLFYRSIVGLNENFVYMSTEEFEIVSSVKSHASYSPIWYPAMIFENLTMVINILFIILIAYFCYRLKKAFRTFAIIFYFVIFFFQAIMVVLMFSINSLYVGGVYTNEDMYTPFLQSIVYASIWIPYFIRSKRVRNTFTN